MSKKMTPCEKLGYKVGDKFEVIEDSVYFKKGEIVSLIAADNSSCPFFINEKVVRDGYSKGCAMYLSDVKKISKLKPAKQALADAINQNGGWRSGANWACQHGLNRMVVFSASGLAPTRNAARGMACWNSGAIFFGGFQFDRKLPNWHQCILSRDEYFTAYPEQVKVEVKNETKHKVEVEMKSESEMTINASDWHKNGELPPVGVGVQLWHGGAYAYDCEVIAKRGNSYVLWNLTWGRADSADCSMCEFRPLRTEREKAIDEMMAITSTEWGSIEDVCGALYMAGYRKEAK